MGFVSSSQSPQGHPWQHKWAEIISSFSRLNGIHLGSTDARMSNRGVEDLLADLFHFCEAFNGDPAISADVTTSAEKLKTRPNRGPVMRCGEVANTKKHTVRDNQKKWSAVISGRYAQPDSPAPWANQPIGSRSWVVAYTDPDGHKSEEDAWQLAAAAFQTWEAFLREHGLP